MPIRAARTARTGSMAGEADQTVKVRTGDPPSGRTDGRRPRRTARRLAPFAENPCIAAGLGLKLRRGWGAVRKTGG